MNTFEKKQASEPVPEAELWHMPELQNANGVVASTGKDKEKAKQEAYAEGFALGLEEGRSVALNENLQLGQQFNEVAGAIDRVVRKLDQSVADELVSLACVMAESIVRNELKATPNLIVDMVTRAIAELPGTYEKITVNLNPEDANVVRQFLNQEGNPLQGEGWAVMEEASMARGDCQIKTTDSILNAEIWRQIQVMLAASIEESAQ